MTGAVDPFILAVKEAKRFIYLPFVILFVLCTARDLCVAYESAFHIERGEHNCSAVGLLEKCSCFFHENIVGANSRSTRLLQLLFSVFAFVTLSWRFSRVHRSAKHWRTNGQTTQCIPCIAIHRISRPKLTLTKFLNNFYAELFRQRISIVIRIPSAPDKTKPLSMLLGHIPLCVA